MQYNPPENRYQSMKYNRCGNSGIKLPAISLGLWHNFGGTDVLENSRSIILHAFDAGINHFDLANNYGPPAGSAEETFGTILHKDLKSYRDELFISTKAGYYMWPGPYGDGGSRKYLISSLDQSLRRMKLDYVDLFYSHRPDPETPIEETVMALNQIVRQGKALYVGISNYKPADARKAIQLLKEMGTPCLIHQAKYSMFERWVEGGLLDVLEETGVGLIAFSPLAQGLLTDRYLKGIPQDSRAAKGGFLKPEMITEEKIKIISQLNEIARQRNQSLAQMALAWLLKDKRVTSVLIGASSTRQLAGNIEMLNKLTFENSELKSIENIITKKI
ncbi:MAG TPA: L-glyceraldehyde 3-phosphate reductase [Bacteroidales bacterium]|nr:L-glyceraldehyde 3-phosphate reductase [Bacteroidales bacterium]